MYGGGFIRVQRLAPKKLKKVLPILFNVLNVTDKIKFTYQISKYEPYLQGYLQHPDPACDLRPGISSPL